MHDPQLVAEVCHPCGFIRPERCCVLNLNLDLHSKPALQPCLHNTINIERRSKQEVKPAAGLVTRRLLRSILICAEIKVANMPFLLEERLIKLPLHAGHYFVTKKVEKAIYNNT